MLPRAGLFSSTMRELTSVGHDGPKWIVLDGDIDPMWIESLNTVMDDNKVGVHLCPLSYVSFPLPRSESPSISRLLITSSSSTDPFLSSPLSRS